MEFDFEDGFDHTRQEWDDDFNWSLGQSYTPSSNTGPRFHNVIHNYNYNIPTDYFTIGIGVFRVWFG